MKYMQEYVVEIKATLLQITAWGSLLVVNAYFAGFRELLLGLVVGTVTSMVYFLLLSYRVRKSVYMSVEKAILYMRIGWLNRLAFIALMLFISTKVPEIDFRAAVMGLFSLHIVMLFKAVFLIIRSGLNTITTGTTDTCFQVPWHKSIEERRREDGTRWRT